MFITEQRGRVQSIMTAMPLLGPIIGLIIGSYLAQAKGWRCPFWLATIMTAIVELGFLILYRETYDRRSFGARRRDGGKRLETWRGIPNSTISFHLL